MSVWKRQQVAVFLKTWLISVMAAMFLGSFLGSAVLMGMDLGNRSHAMPACTHHVPMMVNVLPDIRC